jgi:hypothetical protein
MSNFLVSHSPLSNLVEATRILKDARISVSGGSTAVWNKVDNAFRYLDAQVAALLAE